MCSVPSPRETMHGVYMRLCGTLAAHKQDRAYFEQFSTFSTNRERVKLAYSLLDQYGLFPPVLKTGKNDEFSESSRQKGNQKFKSKKYQEALELYTEGVAYAVEKSPNLGMAFANRSAVLFEKCFFDECLMDIKNAFDNNYPKQFHEKLLQRQQKATNKQRNSKQQQFLPPDNDSNPNKLIECVEDCVKISSSDDFGRFVVATKTINVGDIIAVENSFSCVLLEDSYKNHCYHCLKPSYNLIPCLKCSLALYCGESCRSSSWESYHEFECPVLGSLLALKANKLTLVAFRISITARSVYPEVLENDFGEGDSSIKYREVHNLIANTHLRSVADLFSRAVVAAIICKYLETCTSFFENFDGAREVFMEMMLLHMQTGPNNFHEISELVIGNEQVSQINEIGAAAFSFLSLLNHSCSPNVVRHCHGTVIVLRALRPIREGGQLLDNYGYHHAIMSKTERRSHLKQQYYFDCQCVACKEDWPLYQELPETGADIGLDSCDIVSLQKGDWSVAEKVRVSLVEKAMELDNFMPCKELADVQELLKQCYNIFSNKRVAL